MATSGQATLTFDALELIEEAYERCGIKSLNGYDIRTARRSLNILAQEWANRGLNLWTVEEKTIPLVAGTQAYDLPEDTIDLLEHKIRSGSGTSQVDQDLTRISMPTWAGISNKNQVGAPAQIYIERGVVPKVRVWPVPSTDATLVYWRLRRLQDVVAMTDNFDAPMRFVPALTAGLAFHLAMKRSPAIAPALQTYYEEQFQIAADEDRDRSTWRMQPRIA